jgi:hypothetical protein
MLSEGPIMVELVSLSMEIRSSWKYEVDPRRDGRYATRRNASIFLRNSSIWFQLP